MTRQIIILHILTFQFALSFGQVIYSNFGSLDKAVKPMASTLEFKTNKFSFLSNGDLDTVASKTYLDSLVWFFKKQGQTGMKITMDKSNAVRYDLCETARKQVSQIAKYLFLRGILEIRFPVFYTEDSIIYEENDKASDKTIWTKIIIYNNFIDPSALYLKEPTAPVTCAKVNNINYQIKNPPHRELWLNDKPLDLVDKSDKEIIKILGKPTSILTSPENKNISAWHYYLKYCDKNVYKDWYISINFLKDKATKVIILN